jgi:amino acid transporter
MAMSLETLLFGRPMKTSEERGEHIGPAAGIPIFGLDALSSAGYGPEAALTLLIPLGAAGLEFIVPISAAIIGLLTIVYVSYLQTIEAYPGGGGSYTVARENLGEFAGLLAAAALMIDYVLVVAVGISAGVGALVSAVPGLQAHILFLCLTILALIAFVNLRGVKEAGTFFMIPTYLFVGTLGATILLGLWRAAAAGGHPVPVVAPPPTGPAHAASLWLLLQAFAAGCTAMTGVEAVSNGVKAFRPPAVKNAKISLTIIIGLLILLLAGIAYLARLYGVAATEPGSPAYESVLSQLIGAVAGKGVFYYVAIGSILLVLALSANTAFADFPRMCQVIAHDGYLPASFGARGRRLVYSQGIFVLTALAALLLIVFGGVTDRLIPLFAVGAFLAFTLSQLGMVLHWKRLGGPKAARSMVLNGVGAAATGATVLVILVAKFVEGAWITALLIPGLFLLMKAIRRHYDCVRAELACDTPLDLAGARPPLVIVPFTGWNKMTKKALRFACALSPDIQAVHIKPDGPDEDLRKTWPARVEAPAKAAGRPAPQLKVVASPYRHVLTPIVDHILAVSKAHPEREIAIVIPQIVENRWFNSVLHHQRAAILNAILYFRGARRVAMINVPWYLEENTPTPSDAPEAP